jgi:hypothetical protein
MTTEASARRFPPSWTIDERNDACFIVRDANGQALAYVYFEDEPGRRSAARLLTRASLSCLTAEAEIPIGRFLQSMCMDATARRAPVRTSAVSSHAAHSADNASACCKTFCTAASCKSGG